MRRSEGGTRAGGLPNLLVGAGIGAAFAYFFDPQQGRRRRSLMRDQFARAMSKSNRAVDVGWRDLRHRVQGSLAEWEASLKEGDVPDEVLVDRVRSRMGRYVSHPSSIGVAATGGRVILHGVVLQEEVPELLAAVRSVRGVRDVEDQLDVHASPDVSELQGNGRRPGEPPTWMREKWPPATRLLAAMTGSALMGNCLTRHNPAAILGGSAGFGLFLRALTNIETGRLFGFAPVRGGIDLQKTVTIYAPVEAVFSLLANPENYPRFTRTFLVARKRADDRYQVRMRGPAGTEITLDEIITRCIPHDYVAWISGPESDVRYAGSACFEATSNGGTRVGVTFTYNPPGGVIGHAAARLAGFDPKALWDDVLMRAKSYLETGHRPHDAAEPATPEVQYPRVE